MRTPFRVCSASVLHVTGVALLALSLTPIPRVNAQSPRQSTTAGSPAQSVVSGTIEVRDVFLTIDQIARAQGTPSHSGGTGPLHTVLGDGARKKAAESALRRVVADAIGRSGQTGVVVIGSEQDKSKVVQSLSGVQRPVLVLFADYDARSATYDNTALRGSMLDRLKALNVWVYLRRPADVQEPAPDYTLSTRIVGSATWSSLFVMDGDRPFVGRREPDARRGDVPARSASTPANTQTARPSTSDRKSRAFEIDEVAVTRIDGVVVLAQPAEGAQILTTLKRGDEVIITGIATGGFVKVQATTVEGWVKPSLLMLKATGPETN